MSEMPLEPQLAKMLLISPEFNCSNEVRDLSLSFSPSYESPCLLIILLLIQHYGTA